MGSSWAARSFSGSIRLLLLGSLFSLPLAGCGCGRTEAPPEAETEETKKVDKAPASAELEHLFASDEKAKQAVALYEQHCGACHGAKGDGQGVATPFLFPRPRDFRTGQFRLVSTDNGIPTHADIQAVLLRGMPGSSMPPWKHLSEEEVELLSRQVLQFRRDGVIENLKRLADDEGDELPLEELREGVDILTSPGEPVEVPQIAQANEEEISRGKQIYLEKGCASCHGKEGKGDGQEKMVDAKGRPSRPRDLTEGIFKGQPDPDSVYIRIRAGMPGSPMPASRKLTPEQVVDLTHFVLSLSDESAREAVVLRRERIAAARVKALPDASSVEAWGDIQPVAVRMTPLWWRNEYPRRVEVQAAHDGQQLALRVSWPDATENAHALHSESFEDAAAVELFKGDREPFLGMGAADAPLEVWMWDADRQSDQDIEDANPNVIVDLYPLTETIVDTAAYDRPGTKTDNQDDLTVPARAVGNRIIPSGGGGGSSLETGGPGTVTFRPPVSEAARATGEWSDGRWTVVFTRPLVVEDSPDAIRLEPGDALSVGFAVWDGARRDRNGQKLVTIWQDLVLETGEP